jgi:hypothetical protein
MTEAKTLGDGAVLGDDLAGAQRSAMWRTIRSQWATAQAAACTAVASSRRYRWRWQRSASVTGCPAGA